MQKALRVLAVAEEDLAGVRVIVEELDIAQPVLCLVDVVARLDLNPPLVDVAQLTLDHVS